MVPFMVVGGGVLPLESDPEVVPSVEVGNERVKV